MFWHGLTRTRPNQDDLVTDDVYHFQPLSASTAIRLIKVLPRKVFGRIACRIFHFDEKQQNAIKYHALSYVWGDANQTRQIFLQDQGDEGNEWRPFKLHENLWQFLDHTWRSKLFDHLFWTDYICLNQNGREEISQQVPRMDAIYRNAELVVIWLQLKKDEQEGLRKVVRWRGCPKLMPEFLHRVIQKRVSPYQGAIRGAMNNPYWGRIWIVQEVVVAKKVRVTTGDISIDLDELRALIDSFVFVNVRLFAQQPSMWVLCDMRNVGGKIPLWRILRDFKRYQSSHPVDRVFGMLGLVEDREDGSSPAENIQVDYDKEIWQVLLDAMFESPPPLAEYKMTIRCLEPHEFQNGLSLLKRYIRHRRTMRRHRDFARIALEAFEAFSVIKRVTSAPRSAILSGLVDDLFSSAADAHWKSTLRQSAALIGLLLSSWNKEPLVRWIFRRDELDADRISPWRCAAHVSHDGGGTGLGSPVYEIVAGAYTTWAWDRGFIVDACGQQSENCDGSIMACEMSDIGLRLQVEPGISRGDAGRLSLYYLKLEASGESPAGGEHK